MTGVVESAGVAAAAPAGGFAARTTGLRKTYGETVAVAGVDLAVPRGAVVGVLGPNGSGKTTTIRMLLGLTRPTAGTVEVLGHPMPDGAAHVLPGVGALVEGPGFHPFLSGRENLTRCAAVEPALATGRIRDAVADALERVGLTAAAHRRYKGYSLGMKQRLGLAAALLVPRELVVLDEPTNGLDPAGTREIRRIIADLHSVGTTVVVSSHLLSEVEATCTHVAVMTRGSLVAQGDLGELLESGRPHLVVSTADVEGGLHALRDHGIAAREEDGRLRVELTDVDPPEVIAALVHAGVGVHEARRGRAGLEDLFAQLTEEAT
ncbi:ABC-2 type transport system ATP-binding protein [Saccharopolyspora erythraea NRRL 2338]|uniref:ABC transporter ATP-binding protein n=2 Tax=Saccharopolyspora erythraea TaxID=1836 RepID=A4F8F2_SACEN|nr:ABC transporter ATP-binding protein [Saccharopolyspora erythraea]EQD81489.1 ABC transporter ATP-binding protein [Saccharopolyspora erythraea D]PFG94122.1 ABC-2 type transport system ATP-binding protein [Saccharopolyspora erythraea NRRL 2338]QRK90911.1 ABC transporter ATP-binding protein [Saccharopolyspora erythraea]CAM00327.1 putative ABC transporter ATP-binding protein [Saccharopolyspora erythraea NRRL 2338]